jgi:ferredoxin-thioredoxin reductase catalytic subunit
LNPDRAFVQALLEGLKTNEERYSYLSCPCRLASGRFESDRDILCPCDYRDPDVQEFGACYCALYVNREIYEGKSPVNPIPERRPTEKIVRAYGPSTESPLGATGNVPPPTTSSLAVKMRLWYCRQCGYVTFREEPPYVCPICKAKKEMFSELDLNTDM